MPKVERVAEWRVLPDMVDLVVARTAVSLGGPQREAAGRTNTLLALPLHPWVSCGASHGLNPIGSQRAK